MTMSRIERARLTHVRIPLWEPFMISNGVVAEKDGILIELFADGLVGLGEASPMAGTFYSPETPESSWEVLDRELVPILGRLDAATPDSFNAASAAVSDAFARCGIETALWDLAAKDAGLPLAEFLGGDAGRPVESGLAVGMAPDVKTLIERIGRHMEAGRYRRLKIKVMPGWDVEPLDAVRNAFGSIPLFVDANCAYGPEHFDHIAGWDRFGLMMIEQPLPRHDLKGHAALARRIATPVCLDESAEDIKAVRRAIELGSCRIINIKLQRVGGFGPALQVLRMAKEAGIGCWMGTMPELAVGGWQTVHFATLGNILYPTDVEASERWFKTDVTTPRINVSDGLIMLPDDPGIGVSLDTDIVSKYAVRKKEIKLMR
ncbi:MAG TPA: o-succinylbenzoate synthase [Candidatus Brocadiia bacterium]|nr:o-succinylbenzoate synthase [Candidatus Brocadiia bacterium]